MNKNKKIGLFMMPLLIVGIIISYVMLKEYNEERNNNSENKEINAYESQMTKGENISKADVEQYKKILLKAGTPDEVLADISDEQIAFIAENLNKGEIYEDIDSFEFEPGLINGNDLTDSEPNLSDKLIRITIICFSYKNDGEKQFKFFPSFRWMATGYGIDNDSWGFALNEGWEIVPGMSAQVKVYLKNSSVTKYGKIYYPIDAGQYGYIYGFTDGIAVPNGYYEGYGVFYARKKNIDAANEISMTYVHDSSSLLNDVSYIVSIGPESVSVSFDSPEIQVYENVMTLIINSYE